MTEVRPAVAPRDLAGLRDAARLYLFGVVLFIALDVIALVVVRDTTSAVLFGVVIVAVVSGNLIRQVFQITQRADRNRALGIALVGVAGLLVSVASGVLSYLTGDFFLALAILAQVLNGIWLLGIARLASRARLLSQGLTDRATLAGVGYLAYAATLPFPQGSIVQTFGGVLSLVYLWFLVAVARMPIEQPEAVAAG